MLIRRAYHNNQIIFTSFALLIYVKLIILGFFLYIISKVIYIKDMEVKAMMAKEVKDPTSDV